MLTITNRGEIRIMKRDNIVTMLELVNKRINNLADQIKITNTRIDIIADQMAWSRIKKLGDHNYEKA